MKRTILLPALFAAVAAFAQQQDYPVHGVPFTQVKLTDKFWLPKIETNRTVTIPASFERCENTGRVKNFTMAAEKKVSSVLPILLMILIFIKLLKALPILWRYIPMQSWKRMWIH